MVGPVGVAAVQAIGSLLGGILGKAKRGPSAGDNALSHVSGIMEAAEKFGFNPLTLLGSVGAVGGASPPPNIMGAAIADATMYLGDGINKSGDLKRQRDALAAERDALQTKVIGLTIRPKVPGVYGTMAMGGPNAQRSDPVVVARDASRAGPVGSAVAGAIRPLQDKLPVDPRRAVDNQAQKTHAGFMAIDNPYLPYVAYAPTLDGDEALQWYEYPSLILPGISMGYQHLTGPAFWDPPEGFARDGVPLGADGPPRPGAEMGRRSGRTPSLLSGGQDSGYTVRRRKAPYLP